VTEHHALGAAGGAAGVEDTGERVPAAAGVLDGLGGRDEFFEAVRAVGGGLVTGVDDVLQAGVGVVDALDVAGEGVVDHEESGVDLGEGGGDLRDAPAEVDRDDDPAGPQGRAEELVVAVGVEAQDRGALAVLDAELPECRRQPGDPVDRLGVGPRAAGADGGDPVGALLHDAVQTLGDVHGATSRPAAGRDRTSVAAAAVAVPGLNASRLHAGQDPVQRRS
jgi:hypothetical protein